MGIEVKGKGVKLWINDHTTKDGRDFRSYNVGLSRKNKDGSYVNTYLRAVFGKDVYIPDGVVNGATMDFDGFMSVDSYINKAGEEVKNPMVFITNVQFHKLTETDSFSEAEDDIPF